MADDGEQAMHSKGKTDTELWGALTVLDDDLLDPDLPEAIVEDEIRKLGLDPQILAKTGTELVPRLREQGSTEAP